MSEQMPLDQLIAGVQDLAVKVEQNAEAMQIARAHSERLSRSSRRHRLAIGLTCVGLVADIILSALIIMSYHRVSCVQRNIAQRQGYAERNFDAEYAKVSGQIKGIDEVYKDTKAGVEQFKAASQHYLDEITAIHTEMAAHRLHC